MSDRRFLKVVGILWTFFLMLCPVWAETEKSPSARGLETIVVTVLAYDEDDLLLHEGTGIFLDAPGQLITHRHLLEGSARAEIKTGRGQVYPITWVLADDPEKDLLRVSIDLPPQAVQDLPMTGPLPKIGDEVMLVPPGGIGSAVQNALIVGAKGHRALGDVLQLSSEASIGGIGSPVINRKGEVVGMATRRIVDGEEVGLLLPIETLIALQPEMMRSVARWATPLAEWSAEVTAEWLKTPEGLHFKGLYFISIKDCPKAVQFLKAATRKAPRYAEAWFSLGYCEGELGRWAEAMEAYGKEIEIDPASARAHYNLGWVYSQVGRDPEAIASYETAIRLRPGDPRAHYNLGLIYHRLDRPAQAVEAFRKVIDLHAEDAALYDHLGTALGRVGRFLEAVEAYQQAVARRPDFAEAYFNMGVAYTELGVYGPAADAFQEVLRIRSEDTDALYNLGVAYGEMGLWQGAISAYRLAADRRTERPEVYFNLGVALGQVGRHREAAEAYRGAIQKRPDYAQARYNLAVSSLILDQRDDAREEYLILKALDPRRAEGLYTLLYDL